MSRELTKREWRLLFTDGERLLIDRFNATFETNDNLTEPQRDAVRTGLEDYKAATIVNRDDPATAQVLGLYVALGLLEANRPAEILAEPITDAPAETPAFIATHRVTLGGVLLDACLDPDGTVRLSDGKWTTLDALTAMGKTLEAV